MTQRANSTDTQGTTQPATNFAGSVNSGATVTTFPLAAGANVTVTRLNGAMSAAGTTVGQTVERDSDGGFWDATHNVAVPPDFTSLQAGDDMRA
jgi:hypothetical protein